MKLKYKLKQGALHASCLVEEFVPSHFNHQQGKILYSILLQEESLLMYFQSSASTSHCYCLGR